MAGQPSTARVPSGQAEGPAGSAPSPLCRRPRSARSSTCTPPPARSVRCAATRTGVSSIRAAARHWHIGSAARLVLPDGSRRTVFVAEIYTPGSLAGDYVLPLSLWATAYGAADRIGHLRQARAGHRGGGRAAGHHAGRGQLAVALGVAFLSGALTFGDTLSANFGTLFATAASGTSAAVRSATTVGSGVNAPGRPSPRRCCSRCGRCRASRTRSRPSPGRPPCSARRAARLPVLRAIAAE